ncbi:unnamed protein product [Durusdinium trenchii]|uniref:BCD1 alpha/beta domain-containing protein n=1 Tax=Durusdinium trenchii TaxID=1381693 RepID=A0ABP0SZ88_9DINO
MDADKAAIAAALQELGEDFDPDAGFAVVPLTECPHVTALPAREISMKARCSVCKEEEAHKSQSGCTGKRPRTERVAPLNAFTDNVLLRDFGLLEEVDAAVDRADRDLRIRDEDCAEHAGNVDNRAAQAAHTTGTGLCSTGAANKADPCAFCYDHRSREYFQAGGWWQGTERKGRSQSMKWLGESWQSPELLCWLWQHSSNQLRNVEEREPGELSEESEETEAEAPETACEDPVAMHHRGCTELLRAEESEESESEERQERKDNDGKDPHTDGKESEAVEGKESFHPYVRLDKSRTLRENLMDRAIVEHPVLYVALPQDQNAQQKRLNMKLHGRELLGRCNKRGA